MIQKFVCVPKSDYDVIIVSNGTINQIESKLIELNEHTNNEIPLNSKMTFIDNFPQLIDHFKNLGIKDFHGKVIFMFFNGLNYIQNFLSDIIDYYNNLTVLDYPYLIYNKLNNPGKVLNDSPSIEMVQNVYFYFDSSISINNSPANPYGFLISNDDCNQFNTVISITNDILKKMNFMIGRIRGVYIDDLQLHGEKVYSLHSLMKNFPKVEKIDLSSYTQLLMNDMII